MKKVKIHKINVRSSFRDAKQINAECKINEYIAENQLNVISVSLLKEDEDTYIFTITHEEKDI